jgi:hypothetical protein
MVVEAHPSAPDYGRIVTVVRHGNGIVSGYIDGSTTLELDVLGLLPQNIRAGAVIGSSNTTGTTNMVGTFTSDANATAAQILNGQTAYANGNKITGTMPNYSNTIIDTGVVEDPTDIGVSANAGYSYIRHASKVTGYVDRSTSQYTYIYNLLPENIKAGVVVGNKSGTVGIVGTAPQSMEGNVTSSTSYSSYSLVGGGSAAFYNVTLPRSIISCHSFILYYYSEPYDYITMYDMYIGRVLIFSKNGNSGTEYNNIYNLPLTSCTGSIPVQMPGVSYSYTISYLY